MVNIYHFAEEASIPSPALIYYRDILEKNTQTAIRSANGPEHLWPHVKSHKSQDFTQLQTEMGISRFKCATISEAEMAARTDAEHILVAYPLIGPNINRFIHLSMAYPHKHFYALGDDLKQLELLGESAAANQLSIECFVDVNPGMNRTGILFHDLAAFYMSLKEITGIQPIGFHCYDGNRHEMNYKERENHVLDTIDMIQTVQNQLEHNGFSRPILIMGGSPTFPCYVQNMKNAFFSPGTIFLYDSGYKKQFPDLPYSPGAAVMSRVISHPADGYFSLDAGYKAISAEQGIRGVIPELPHSVEAFQSEEHWTFCMEKGFEEQRPPIGTVIYIIPWHICPTSALYEKAIIISNGHFSGTWPITARNRILQF